MIIVSGFNVFPNEVEAVAAACAGRGRMRLRRRARREDRRSGEAVRRQGARRDAEPRPTSSRTAGSELDRLQGAEGACASSTPCRSRPSARSCARICAGCHRVTDHGDPELQHGDGVAVRRPRVRHFGLGRGRSESHRPVRGLHRRPAVDPRRCRARQAREPVRRTDRPWLPQPVAGRRDGDGARRDPATMPRPGSTTDWTRSASSRRSRPARAYARARALSRPSRRVAGGCCSSCNARSRSKARPSPPSSPRCCAC